MAKRKNDLILIGAACLLALLLWLGVSLFKGQGAEVVITVNGEQWGRYSLSEDATVVIENGEHSNTLIISGGKARVDDASCPDKLCVKMGEAEFSGQSIICLPNKVVIEIVGGKSGGEDAVAR